MATTQWKSTIVRIRYDVVPRLTLTAVRVAFWDRKSVV